MSTLQGFDFSKFQAEAIKQLKSGKPLNGKEGVLTPLIMMIFEAALDGEIESHLKADDTNNGRTSKVVRTDQSAVELETPRDRNGTFEPEIVKKRQTYLGDALDNKVIDLYALGMSYKVYQASTKSLAESKLAELDETWGKKYPIVIKSWKANWDNLSNYFKYPLDIRRIIYITNVIEGFHRQLRKVTKTKGAFATENALLKLL